MNLNYTDEQQMLRDGIAKFIKQEYSFEKRMSWVSDSDTVRHWPAFAEMGWLMVPFGEDDGGISGSAVDIGVVMEEFGRGLVVEPYVASTVLAGGLLSRAGSDGQKAELLEPIMGGELRLAVAFAEPASRYQLSHVATRAEREDDNYRLNGHKAVVLGGDVADKLIVAARTSGDVADAAGITLFLMDVDAVGVERHAYQTVDGQGAADIVLEDVLVPATNLVGVVGEGLLPLSDAVDRASLAISAEAVGAMEAALAITLEYARTRKQFGRPIASFQALQHRMVEMLIEIEQSRSIVLKACLALDSGDESATKAISAAKLRIDSAAKRVGEEAVQIHGAIGITNEYSIGHYLKRLTAIRYTFGSADYHRQRYLAAA
jgi:alkylation response protein AidB-like acyl-CoA dehydrogenase